MNFDGLVSELWMSPFMTWYICAWLCIGVVILGFVTAVYLYETVPLETAAEKVVASGLGLAFLALAATTVTGFVMAEQDRRQGHVALTAAVRETYGLELGPPAISKLLADRGLFELSQGGAEQMREQAGTAELVVEDEPVTLTLSWNADEWIILGVTPSEADGQELPRVNEEPSPAEEEPTPVEEPAPTEEEPTPDAEPVPDAGTDSDQWAIRDVASVDSPGDRLVPAGGGDSGD